MLRRRSVVSLLSTLVITTACLAALSSDLALAAADPTDKRSITIGSQMYKVYCSDCHGADTGDRYAEEYDSGEVDISDDYSEWLALVRGVDPSQRRLVPAEDWPEWAENPAPLVERKPDVRSEVVDAMTGAIGSVQVTPLDPDDPGNWGDETSVRGVERLEVMPGATNLADPAAYFYGTSEQDLFNSIAHGTGTGMPGWRTELGSDEAIWDLVNYIRSLWDEHWLY